MPARHKAVSTSGRVIDCQTVTKLTAKFADLRKAEKQTQAAEAAAIEARMANEAAETNAAEKSANKEKDSAKGEKDQDCENCGLSKGTAAKKAAPRSYKVTTAHRAGNRQVIVNGQRWNVPKGMDSSTIPHKDPLETVFNKPQQTPLALGTLVVTLHLLSERPYPTHAPSMSIGVQISCNNRRRGGGLKKKVNELTKKDGFDIEWSRKAVDVISPSTELRYDIMSGSKSNMDWHAKRMPDELFRVIIF